MPPMASPERLAFYESALINLHVALEEHPLTKLFLDGRGIKVDGQPLAASSAVTLDFDLGGSDAEISARDFAQLFGVFNGSRVHVQRDNSWGNDEAPPGLYVTVINPSVIQAGHKNRSGLFRDHGTTGLAITAMFIDHFMLRDVGNPKLLGTVSFGLCALQAYLLGLDRIELIAAGGIGFRKQFYGYYVWPKLGFDANLLPDEGEAMGGCSTVLEAMARNSELWRVLGTQRLMRFDLAPDSASRRTLLDFARSKALWSTP